MIASPDPRLIRRILSFWFADGPAVSREVWFKANPSFDKEISRRFRRTYERAAAGELDGLAENAEGSLALVLLLDQFPRNLFRGTAGAFASDGPARAVARHALKRGFDRPLPPAQRLFLYLPFEHSEDLADQEQSVALFAALGDAEWLDYAKRHRDIVARFGRFPHRNAALGRPSTPEEVAFLQTPGSSF